MKLLLKISAAAICLIFIVNCKPKQTTQDTNSVKTEMKQEAFKGKKPNIIFVLCDDLGYSDVGFNGGKDVRTPNLDILAANGTQFTSAYTPHPFCGPSRAGIMTGRYPHTIGTQFNLPPNSEQWNLGIPTKQIFLPKTLQKAGYYTGAVGKWHLGANPEFHPNVRGFDDFYGFLGGGHKYFPKQYQAAYERQKKNGNKVINDYLSPLQHNGEIVKETEYITDAFSREAVRFIKDASTKEEPFFLYVAYNAPHSPLEAKKDDKAKFAHIKDEKRKTFAAMVYAVDRGVGEITEALRAAGELENTMIIFMSDNGGKKKLGGTNYPLKGQKGDTNEGGFRSPMFVHYPAQVKAGQRYDYPITALDFYPTFSYLAGADLPVGQDLAGKNIWNAITEGKNARPGEMIYALRHRNGYSDVGIRKDNWKATRTGNTWKLYKITEDPGEQNDLSGQYPDVLREMVAEGNLWSKEHIQPLFWHDDKTGRDWKADNMPHYDRAFQIK